MVDSEKGCCAGSGVLCRFQRVGSFHPKKGQKGQANTRVIDSAVGTGIVNPGASQIVREFQITNPAFTPLLISVHVIGMAIGPLVVSPASELWGRCPLMHVSNVLLMLSLGVGALSTDITTLLVARVITGMAGCIPIVLEGGFIADLVAAEKRGKIIAVWALAPVSVCTSDILQGCSSRC